MSSKIEQHLSENEKFVEAVKVKKARRLETNYFESLTHLFKGNVGPGCYAFAEAIKNSGLILGSILTVSLSTICVYQQHVLMNCSDLLKDEFNLDKRPDYAETLEMSFMSNKKWRDHAKLFKRICNTFLVLTQLGFCSVYFLFVSANVKKVLDFYGLECEVQYLMIASLVPIILTSLIRNLRYLAPFSGIANLFMIAGIIITFYYTTRDLPHISERKLAVTSPHQLALFYGTAVYLFEGIGLVLPLKNAMRKPNDFSKPLGVLNVGMVFLTIMFIAFGFFGYWKCGEDVASSLTLNLPSDEWLGQSVMLMIALGVILSYAIQFFIPIQIMFPAVRNQFKLADSYPVASEVVFRIFMIMVTFVVALAVPNVGLLISLIGAVCSTSLALVFPVLAEYLVLTRNDEPLEFVTICKNLLILSLAAFGFITGGYESIRQIAQLY